jgi:ribosomal protein S18 acetylase RimI-like enzyme
MPSCARIRGARPEDYAGYVRLYREISLGEDPAEREEWDRALHRQSLFAVEDDGIVGFVRYELFDDFAYVHHLAVAPEARRQGIGLALMQRAAIEIRARGVRRWSLHVLEDNASARRLYASVGLQPAGRSTMLRIGFDALAAATPPEASLSVASLPPERDAEAEQTFRYSPGRLARSRQNPECRVTALFEADGTLLGMALHASRQAFAHPLSVTRAEHAIPLLAGLRRWCPDSTLRVGVDDNPEVEAALTRAGASVMHRSLLLGGDIG